MRLRDRYRIWKRRRAYRQYGASESEIDSIMQMKQLESWMEDRGRRAEELQQQAATRGDRRSIGVLLNNLFDAIPDPNTGQPYSSAQVAQATEGQLSKDWIEAVRESRSVPVSLSDLYVFCGFFGVDHNYWRVEVEDEELEPEVREARKQHRAAKRNPEEGELAAGHRLFMADLHSLVSSETQNSVCWTPEEIGQATDGCLGADKVRELLSSDEPSLRFKHLQALGEDVIGYPDRVWFEKYFAPWEINNFIR